VRQLLILHRTWLLSLFALSGCASPYEDLAVSDHARVLSRTSAAQQQLHGPAPDVALVAIDSRLRFTSKSVPFDAGQLLPAQIKRVTLKAAGSHNLSTVSEWIEGLIRIPVRVSADALLPPSAFVLESAPLQRPGGGPTGATPQGSRNPASDASRSAAEAIETAGGPRLLPVQSEVPLISLDYEGDLHGLLDYVASRTGVQWTYSGGQIRFFRMVSRSITMRSLPGNLTQSGGVQLGGGMSLNSDSEMNIWTGIEKNLTKMVSRVGWFSVDSTMGLVTVRDSASNVEAIERYLDGINRQLSRQVSLNVEVLQVTLNNKFQRGIDWSYVRQVTGMGLLTAIASPSVTTNTGSVGFIRANADGSTNNLLIKALESFGRVSTSYSSVINTMNRQPVPLGSVNTQSYLKQITPSVVSGSGSVAFGPPGLTPGEIVTGFNITLLPVILDSNMVLLQCGVSISSLKEIMSFTSGSGLSQQTIQQPNVSSFVTQQRMAVRSGDTVVLSGFETASTDSKQSDLVRDVVPGSRSSSRDRTTLVLMITPRLLELQ
jgi:hypothetical protein